MTDDNVYQMLWDCGYCGANKLLGKNHRYCPQCGAAQDADTRYFPEDQDKVRVEDHIYVGVDWLCEGCKGTNPNNANHCGTCGAGKESAKQVSIVGDNPAPSAPPSPPLAPQQSAPTSKKIIPAVLGVLALALVAVLIFVFWTKEGQVNVQTHSWQRSIDIEEYKRVHEQNWRNRMPPRAYNSRCRQKQRDTRQVPDGETCQMVKRDQGDGTFREEQQCKTRYKSEPVYDSYCNYSVDRWTQIRKASAKGEGLKAAWPAPEVKSCATQNLGCQRLGPRSQSYSLSLKDDEGQIHDCDYPEDKWRQIADASTWLINFRVIDGGADCASLKNP
jgi:hypothetical protein